ncbi:Lrp/AsnC family transcriptional regulator [Rhizobium sp. 9T]|uniref:Lrp/AsnC family transcriptional regulator n=1 Tax=Rhizobium croatiense TaxID=2867516 RepID=A0ABS7M6H9_9HYPH|nr:Lrp/AsnC family transcriptional regulator [Rhizobium croatiense]MBY4632725.1 Lrp/AsnC family transcriptional regulator [Rhizobium croatiense]
MAVSDVETAADEAHQHVLGDVGLSILEGFIEGHSAQINVAKLGQTLTVFTEITLKNHRQVDFARFLATVEKVDQVIECHLVSGGYDYLLKFVTSDIGEYQTIMERLSDLEIGIDKYFSFVVLKSPIVKAHMPLTRLFPLWVGHALSTPRGHSCCVCQPRPLQLLIRRAEIRASSPSFDNRCPQ